MKKANAAPVSIAEALNDCRGELMGISAIMIVAFHLFLPVMSDIPVLREIEEFMSLRGFWGVEVFFLLSGAGLVRSIQTHSLAEFYYRRFKRLFLPYFLIALLYFLKGEWTFVTFIKAITGVGFIMGDIHLFLWFVPAITICYIFFPLYYHFYKKSRRPVLFAVIVALVFIVVEIIAMNLGFVFHSLLMFRVPTFILGSLIADQKDNPHFRLTKKVVIIAIVVMVIGIVLLSGIFPQLILYTYLVSELVGVPFAILLAALHTQIGKDMILRRAMRFVGKESLELYCLHPYFFNTFAIVYINTVLPHYFSSSPNLLINICVLAICIFLGFLLRLLNDGFCKLLDKIVYRKSHKTEA